MNKEQLLEALGVTADELQSFLEKLEQFVTTLDPNERAMFERSQPTLQQALGAFGPSLNPQGLTQLFEVGSHPSVTLGVMMPKPNRPS